MKTTRRNFILPPSGSLGAFAATVPGRESIRQASWHDRHPGTQSARLAEADVVVCGGGTAGITAACSQPVMGEVILIERWPCVGGMATARW